MAGLKSADKWSPASWRQLPILQVPDYPDAKVLGDVRQALKDVAGENVAVEVKIDPAIIGGIVVKLGSRMVDASLRTKLNGIRTAMKEVG